MIDEGILLTLLIISLCLYFLYHSCFQFEAPTRLVSAILGVSNLHTTTLFLACLFVISIRYSLPGFFLSSYEYIYIYS